MNKILPRDNPIEIMLREDMEISLAKGEKESFQIVVIPAGEGITDVGITVGDLVSDGGINFYATSIDTAVVGYVQTQTDPRSGTPYIGWWPDPILSFLQTTDIGAGDAQSFWVRVSAPEDQAPGVYQGTLNVQTNGTTLFSFELTVRVRDFSMPATSPLPTAITFAPTSTDWEYIWEDPTLKIEWADFLADYYISYNNLYTADGPDLDVIEHLDAAGRLGMFNLRYFYRSNGTTTSAWDATMAKIQVIYDEVQSRGLLDHAYLYGNDEFSENQHVATEAAAQDLKQAFPDVMVMTTAIDNSYGLNSAIQSIDAWCPYTSTFSPEKAETVRAAGKQVWWY
ncbi:MAG: DUF6067 family protein, partial [Candidatus Marinimicrobia bacterium]|nr:DUF6067 family protein [Candidatus Neomarinimicrobiota bacterium]